MAVMHGGRAYVFLAVAAVLLAGVLPAQGQGRGRSLSTFSGNNPNADPTSYKPSQINHPVPKFEYTDDGQAIMLKRHPYFQGQTFPNYIRYKFVENKGGIGHVDPCAKLQRRPEEILSEEQRSILREWGQPDYLRGPYKSDRGEHVVEWAYHPLNRIFQFVDRKMVYEGPLTDQDRTMITYGEPKEVQLVILEPNIRRETWIYRPTFIRGHEMLFSFANGKLIVRQQQEGM